jgi:multiple sugar transport system permease protein
MTNRRRKITKLVSDILVWFGFIAIAAFVLLPLLWGLRTSLAPEFDSKIIPSSFTLKNYISVMSRPELFLYSGNSLIISIATIAIVLPIALVGAYALARFNFIGKEFGVVFMIIPLLPAIAVLVPLVTYMNKLHMYNSLIAVILVNSVFNLPFAIWTLRNFIISNPISIEEAALIDGCSRMQMLFSVAIPMMKPGIVSVVVYTFINSWNSLIFSFALTPSPKLRVMPQGILAFMGTWGTQWGGLTALGILALIPPLVLFLLFQKYFVAGLFGTQLK